MCFKKDDTLDSSTHESFGYSKTQEKCQGDGTVAKFDPTFRRVKKTCKRIFKKYRISASLSIALNLSDWRDLP
jgi:hypothetical protein